MTNNVFSALGKYNSAVDENYLTESFVLLINIMLDLERDRGLHFLNWLCAEGRDFHFSSGESISIVTQVTTAEGRPDIRISTPDKLIYIEVKHDSDLGDRQIERYQSALKSSVALIKHVILLTRFQVDFDQKNLRPYKHVRWFHVGQWLSRNRFENKVVDYFSKTFIKFLEEKNMTLEKVSWEYINGFQAFRKLMNMLSVAMESLLLKVRMAEATGWAVFYIGKGTNVPCGIYYDKPLLIQMRVYKGRQLLRAFELDLEKEHFFSLDADDQLELIKRFIKVRYAEAQNLLP